LARTNFARAPFSENATQRYSEDISVLLARALIFPFLIVLTILGQAAAQTAPSELQPAYSSTLSEALRSAPSAAIAASAAPKPPRVIDKKFIVVMSGWE
jgi:hypothetical protein